MPAGVEVLVEDGFATIDFVDRAKRGPGLQTLIEIGGAETIEKMTRTGPRALYRVPEGNAREAGLLDDEAPTDEPPATEEPPAPDNTPSDPEPPTSVPDVEVPTMGNDVPTEWPEGDPSKEWNRAQLDAYANQVKGIDSSEALSKADVVALINAPATEPEHVEASASDPENDSATPEE